MKRTLTKEIIYRIKQIVCLFVVKIILKLTLAWISEFQNRRINVFFSAFYNTISKKRFGEEFCLGNG